MALWDPPVTWASQRGTECPRIGHRMQQQQCRAMSNYRLIQWSYQADYSARNRREQLENCKYLGESCALEVGML